MADRIYQRGRTLQKEAITMYGSFQLTSGNAIVNEEHDASQSTTSAAATFGITVTRTGVGIYVLTLADVFQDILFSDVSIITIAASALFSQIASETLVGGSGGSTAIITIRIVNGSGVAADLTDNTTDPTAKVRFMVVTKNSSV